MIDPPEEWLRIVEHPKMPRIISVAVEDQPELATRNSWRIDYLHSMNSSEQRAAQTFRKFRHDLWMSHHQFLSLPMPATQPVPWVVPEVLGCDHRSSLGDGGWLTRSHHVFNQTPNKQMCLTNGDGFNTVISLTPTIETTNYTVRAKNDQLDLHIWLAFLGGSLMLVHQFNDNMFGFQRHPTLNQTYVQTKFLYIE